MFFAFLTTNTVLSILSCCGDGEGFGHHRPYPPGLRHRLATRPGVARDGDAVRGCPGIFFSAFLHTLSCSDTQADARVLCPNYPIVRFLGTPENRCSTRLFLVQISSSLTLPSPPPGSHSRTHAPFAHSRCRWKSGLRGVGGCAVATSVCGGCVRAPRCHCRTRPKTNRSASWICGGISSARGPVLDRIHLLTLSTALPCTSVSALSAHSVPEVPLAPRACEP